MITKEEKKVPKVNFNEIINLLFSSEISDQELLSLKLWLDSNLDNGQIFDK
jgi:hypothetical protein